MHGLARLAKLAGDNRWFLAFKNSLTDGRLSFRKGNGGIIDGGSGGIFKLSIPAATILFQVFRTKQPAIHNAQASDPATFH